MFINNYLFGYHSSPAALNAEECTICCTSMEDAKTNGKTIAHIDPMQKSRKVHAFHHSCIEKWFESKNTCPMCRCPREWFFKNRVILQLLKSTKFQKIFIAAASILASKAVYSRITLPPMFILFRDVAIPLYEVINSGAIGYILSDHHTRDLMRRTTMPSGDVITVDNINYLSEGRFYSMDKEIGKRMGTIAATIISGSLIFLNELDLSLLNKSVISTAALTSAIALQSYLLLRLRGNLIVPLNGGAINSMEDQAAAARSVKCRTIARGILGGITGAITGAVVGGTSLFLNNWMKKIT